MCKEDMIFMDSINFEGNLIDDGWYEHLKYPNGKPHINAILILSEITYWHRPTRVKDELSGKVIGLKKKYKADKLQKSYQQLADRFGMTKSQVKAACAFLQGKGIIDLELRTIYIHGKACNNVMFIGLNVATLKEITGIKVTISDEEEQTNVPLCHYNDIGYDIIMGEPMPLESHTNTKNTTETTPKTTEILEEEDDAFAEVVKLFRANLTKITLNDVTIKLLKQYCCQHGYEYIRHIIEILAKGDIRSFNGFETYLEGYISKGLTTIAKLDRYLNAKKIEGKELLEKEQNQRRKRAEGQPTYGKQKTDNFCNFEQRDYDYEDLEKQLLGTKEETEEQPEVGTKPKTDSNINLQQFYSDLKKNSKMTDTSINTWIKPLEIDLKGDSVSIVAPNAMAKKFVEQHYIQPIANALNISQNNIKIVEG